MKTHVEDLRAKGRALLVAAAACAALAACGGGGSEESAAAITKTSPTTSRAPSSTPSSTTTGASPSAAVVTAAATTSTEGRLLASNCFQCHGTNGTGGFDSIRGGEAKEVQEFLTKAASKDIMAAHAQGYTPAQLQKIVAYLQQ